LKVHKVRIYLFVSVLLHAQEVTRVPNESCYAICQRCVSLVLETGNSV